jgi:hypothetical protein
MGLVHAAQPAVRCKRTEVNVDVSREELMQSMQGLSDGELLRHLGNATLTPQAIEVATALLRSRGIDPAAATSPDGEPGPDEEELVTIAEYLGPTEASLLRGVLESRGIAVHIWGEYVGAAQVVLPTAGGGAHLQVHKGQLEAAQAVMAAYERGDLEIPAQS